MLGSAHLFTTLPDFNDLSYWEKEMYINHTDYLIIGSGIVGLSTAIHLKQRHPSKKVTVLERGYLPTGASSKNAGFACIGSPSEILADMNTMSDDTVLETIQKRWDGLNYLRELVGDQTMDYQSNGSYELFNENEKDTYTFCLDKLTFLNRHLQEITGINNVFKPANNVCNQSGFKYFQYAISHAAEGQINTGKMIHGLCQMAKRLDILLLNAIEAKTIDGQRLITNFGSMSFNKIALCTNGFAKQFLPNEDINPARAQVLVTAPISKLKFKGIYHFDEGYYYFRNIGNRVLFGGGRNLDFKGETTTKIATTEAIISHLKELLKTQILPNTDFEIEHSWAGIMGVGKTKMPIVKNIDKNIYCGIRLGGMGVAIGTLVGKELAALMD